MDHRCEIHEGERELKDAGYGLLATLVTDLIDSDRMDGYEPDRVYEAVAMAPDFFWDSFVKQMLDQMANNLIAGFEEVDDEDE